MASFSVCSEEPYNASSRGKTIPWCPSTVETFGINSTGSGKEIAGLNTMTRKSLRSGFFHGKLEAGMNRLRLCIAREGSESCC